MGSTPTDIQARQPVVAMFNVGLIGHVNPTFALVVELVRRGCRVHYFLPPDEDVRQAAKDSGAAVEGLMEGDPQDFVLDTCGSADVDKLEGDPAMNRLAVYPLVSVLLGGEYVISRCKALGVSAVLYDPILPHGVLVAELLKVPAVSLVTFPGLGSASGLMDAFAGRASRIREPYGERIREKFGVDLQVGRLSRVQYFAPENFVTTSEALVAPLPPVGEREWADELRELHTFSALGCMVNDKAPHVTVKRADGAPRTPSTELPTDIPHGLLQAVRARGGKVVLAAMGTMATSERWAQDLGATSGGNLPAGTTGKQFCQHAWRALLAVFSEIGDDFHCVLCVGVQADALDFLEGGSESIPSNVSIRSSVSQVEMLSNYADAFISHVGFNSMQESLFAGVPLIAVPQAVDQPANARKAESSGWGRAFLEPMSTLTSESLRAAIRDVTSPEAPYAAAALRARDSLRGGECRAADRVLELIRQPGARA